MIYTLPTSVEILGEEHIINTDFRVILDLFEVLNDVDLTDRERGYLALGFFYPEFDKIPPEGYEEAVSRLNWFVNGGKEEQQKNTKKLMDWEQDFPLIIAPVNRIIGCEVRSLEYLHWWTFLSAFMEIGECTFAQVLHIRQEKSAGKKLSKVDADWYRKNRDIVDLKTKYSDAETELLKYWGGL